LRKCGQTLDEVLEFAQPRLNPATGTHVIAPFHRSIDKPYNFAITNSGRFAVLSTVGEEPGSLLAPDWTANDFVANFIMQSTSAIEYLNSVHRHVVLTNSTASRPGFNLVAGDGVNVAYMCSRTRAAPVTLVPGVHVLSNGLLGTPWPKLEWLRGRSARRASELIKSSFVAKPAPPPTAAEETPQCRKDNYELCDAMLHVMSDRTAPLLNPKYHVAPPVEIERFVETIFTPAFLVADKLCYGTHTTVVAVIPPFGECLYAQRSLLTPVNDPAQTHHESVYCRKDVVFHRIEEAAAVSKPVSA
jgi:uncharacterized protein with NRDE domain